MHFTIMTNCKLYHVLCWLRDCSNLPSMIISMHLLPSLLQDILEISIEYLERDKKCQNEVSRLFRSLLPCPFVHFKWIVEVLKGFHLMEPFPGIMLEPRPNHLQLNVIWSNPIISHWGSNNFQWSYCISFDWVQSYNFSFHFISSDLL